MRKLTLEEVLEKFKDTHGRTYDYSAVEYTASHSQVDIICSRHGKFSQRVYDHINGAGCPECASEAARTRQRTPWEEVKKKFLEVWGDRYTYHEDSYVNSRTKIKITCPEHGPFYQTPSQHAVGRNGCKGCSGYLTPETFLAKLPRHEGYDYSQTEYVGSRTNVKVVCLEHGEFYSLPHVLLGGSRCPKCAIEVSREKRKKGPSHYLTKFRELHGEKYTYPEHFNGNDKITIECTKHGEFTQLVQDHRDGHGCPRCFYDNPNTALSKEEFVEKHGNPVHVLQSYSGYFEPTTVKCLVSGIEYPTTPGKYAVSPSNRCPHCSKVSTPHRKVLDEIDKWEMGIVYEINTRQVIPPLEVDIYFPEHKLAIEVCGLYYHSHTLVQDKNYHQNKFELCEERGVRLLQIWESEIRDRLPLVMSMIKSQLGLVKNRIHARKCEVVDLTASEFRQFLMENHLESGGVSSRERKGLMYDGTLVAVMGFREEVLQRYCNLRDTVVVGGFSKLLASFNKSHVVTYSDNRYSNGELYRKLGFRHTKSNSYRLHVTDKVNLYNREKFSKKYLKDYPGYSEDLTAEEILVQSGYHYIYGPGTRRWELRK